MSKHYVPSLSLAGWINDDNVLLSKLYSYFITSHYEQTNIYIGQVSSLKYLLNEFGNNPDSLQANIESTLTSFLKRYFNSVAINVTYNDDETINSREITIEITADSATLSRTELVVGGELKIFNDRINEIYT